MEVSDIRKNYPATYYDLLRWCQIELSDYPEQIQEITSPEKYLDRLTAHPRYLLDYFDSKGLYLSVGRGSEGDFDYEIFGQKVYAKNFITRLECEGDGLLELFKLLEERLNKPK